jgi:hypothetical protein
VHEQRLAGHEGGGGLQQEVRAGRLSGEARENRQVGVVVDDRAQRLVRQRKLRIGTLLHQCHHPPTHQCGGGIRSGGDHGACDGQAADLWQLHTADTCLGLVVHAEPFADVGEVDADCGRFDQQLAGTRPRVRQGHVLQHFRAAEAVVLDSLHRASKWFGD